MLFDAFKYYYLRTQYRNKIGNIVYKKRTVDFQVLRVAVYIVMIASVPAAAKPPACATVLMRADGFDKPFEPNPTTAAVAGPALRVTRISASPAKSQGRRARQRTAQYRSARRQAPAALWRGGRYGQKGRQIPPKPQRQRQDKWRKSWSLRYGSGAIPAHRGGTP